MQRKEEEKKKKKGAIPPGKGICRDLCIPSVPPSTAGPHQVAFVLSLQLLLLQHLLPQCPGAQTAFKSPSAKGLAHVGRGRCRAGMGEFFPILQQFHPFPPYRRSHRLTPLHLDFASSVLLLFDSCPPSSL